MDVKNKLQNVMINTTSDVKNLDVAMGIIWEKAEGVKEVMEAVLNLVAVEQAMRPHSFMEGSELEGAHDHQGDKNIV